MRSIRHKPVLFHILETVVFLFVLVTTSISSSAEEIQTFTAAEREQALIAARQYVEVKYVYNNESMSGVAYLNGGQDTVDAYLDKVRLGAIPGVNAGIDASGLVVNAYRAAYPGLRFVYQPDPQGKTLMIKDASSETIYRWNVKHIDPEDLTPGDLIFFGNSPDQITGVGIYAGKRGSNLRVIVASASKKKVIETGILLGGDYWENNIVGIGRLIKW